MRLLVFVLCLAMPVVAGAQDMPVIPDWNTAGHGSAIKVTDLGNGTRVYETRISIGGGRRGFGRALSRLANSAGVGGYALTVRTETGTAGPSSDVQVSVYLKDLFDYMPSSVATTLNLGEGVMVTLRRDGPAREYGGDLREADYRGTLSIADYLAVVRRSTIDGSFEGREFRIETKQLDALRDVLLRVASAGSTLVPAPSLAVAAAETDAVAVVSEPSRPAGEDIPAVYTPPGFGPPPLSTDSVAPVPPPHSVPADAGAWAGLYHGSYAYKEEGDSFSVEVLLRIKPDGTYALAYAEHFHYHTYVGGHFTTGTASITLMPPLVGRGRVEEPCTISRSAAGAITGLAACMGWRAMDGGVAPLLLRQSH